MHTFVENLQGLWKRITITLSCDYINKSIDEKFKNLSKTIRISGFRIGKVPITILEQQYGSTIRQEVLTNLMKEKFISFVSKNNIKLASYPKYNIVELCNGVNKKFIYSVLTEIHPTIQLQGVDSILLKKPVIKITENDINSILDTVKKKSTFWENNNNKKINIGDRVTFSISIESSNVKINHNFDFSDIEKSIVMIITKNSNNNFIYNLEKKLIGCVKGDEFSIYMDCPDNYYLADIQGTSILIIVKIEKIEIAKFSILHENYFQYYDPLKIKKNIQFEIDDVVRQNIKNQVIHSILHANNFDIPETLVKYELNSLNNKTKKTIYYIDDTFSDSLLRSLIFKQSALRYQARQRVKISLLLNKIIEMYKIKVDYESISQYIEKSLDTSNYSKKIIRSLKNDITTKNYVSAMVLEERVINFLIQRSKITETECSLHKAINYNVIMSNY